MRRSAKTSDDEAFRQKISQINNLTSGIQALGNEMRRVNRCTEEPVISKDPAAARVGESEPGTMNDDRTVPSAKIAPQVNDAKVDYDRQTFPDTIGSEKSCIIHRVLMVEDDQRANSRQKIKICGPAGF